MKTNCEGLTWDEWAYAAAIPEPTWDMRCTARFSNGYDHWQAGYSQHFRKEREAWRGGEDPTDWRADASACSSGR